MIIKHLSKRERILFYITLLFIVGVLFNFLIISPLANLKEKLSFEIIRKEIALKKNMSVISKKKEIQENYNILSNFIKKQGSDEEESANLLKEIETLASKSKISLINIKPKPPKEMEFYKIYSVEIEGEGYLEQLVRFIYNLEQSKQLLKAEKLNISVKSSSSSTLKFSLLVGTLFTD
ncbi:MAG: type 4a pilus biogenesis protein PilO [bacterium]